MFIASYAAVHLSGMSVTVYCTWAKPSSIYFVCVWAEQLMAIQYRSEPRSTMTCEVIHSRSHLKELKPVSLKYQPIRATYK